MHKNDSFEERNVIREAETLSALDHVYIINHDGSFTCASVLTGEVVKNEVNKKKKFFIWTSIRSNKSMSSVCFQ